jgi:hypothetical protein
VATGHSHRLRDMVTLAGEVLRLRHEIVETTANPEREFDLVFQTDALRSLLPRVQLTDLTEGLRSYQGIAG